MKANENKQLPTVTDKGFNRVNNASLTILELVAVRDKKSDTVTQIRFKLDSGETFTYKPSIRKETETKGVLTVVDRETVSPKLEELPSILFELHDTIQKKKKVVIISSYTEMTTKNREGKEVVYCFFNDGDIRSLVIV
jgi:hypothetical protein